MTQTPGDLERELLDLSRRLLDSIDNRNWPAYAALCDESLTAFEPEAQDHLVAGLDFHRFYFELVSSRAPSRSTISSPDIRLMGDAAVVSYVRLVQSTDADGTPQSAAVAETRVWHRRDGAWRHVHFHRSTAPGRS